jgi:SAM-dependent methyltransferase
VNLGFHVVRAEPLRRTLLRRIAAMVLGVRRRRIERTLKFPLSFRADLLCVEERFGDDASAGALLRILAGKIPDRVLIPGCYLGGADVQFWLRRGVPLVDGIDLNNLTDKWRVIVPELEASFGGKVRFQQAPMERMPFPEGSFDIVATAAVLEHVQNLDSISRETARVLKPGGLAWHSFGPLYFSFGGDHCMAAYGEASGFDHLLLPEEEYKSRIANREFFDRQPDPNLPFWALKGQF